MQDDFPGTKEAVRKALHANGHHSPVSLVELVTTLMVASYEAGYADRRTEEYMHLTRGEAFSRDDV
jgi:hypothetical protein